MSALRHLTSFLSFTFIAVNLLLWLPLLVLATIVRICLPFDNVRNVNYRMVETIYRLAVRIDAWWINRVLGIEFTVSGEAQLLDSFSTTNPVFICNHQSWFDIFLLQSLISSKGPILKFVIKVELLWVPVLGWICLVMNFPRLKRKSTVESRARDFGSLQTAALSMGNEPGGLLIFPEGTRFSEKKRAQLQSPYQYLLPPKPGGFSIIKNTLPDDTRVIDISIRYDERDANVWRCMSGAVDNIRVHAESFSMQDIDEVPAWLNKRWSDKALWLATHEKSAAVRTI